MAGPPTPPPPGDFRRLACPAGLCETCLWARIAVGRASAFLRCGRAEIDPRFLQYPPLPVRACPGWEVRPEAPEVPENTRD